MKNYLLLFCSMFFLLSCEEKASTETTKPDAAESNAADTVNTVAPEVTDRNIEYAYIPQNHPPDNWEMGDQQHIAIVLKSLKAFETGNIEEALEAFADSVHWRADELDQKMSRAEIKKALYSFRSDLASLKIEMEDYEAVRSKDKSENWVSLWYKQVNTYKSGEKDSAYHMDDLRIQNGKIIELDEKTRKYPVTK